MVKLKNPPYYRQALQRILAMRECGQAENITIFCGEAGRAFAETHSQWRGACIWLPPDDDPHIYDWTWLKGHDVFVRGHGKWRSAQETALAVALLEAGVVLATMSRFKAINNFESCKTYGTD